MTVPRDRRGLPLLREEPGQDQQPLERGRRRLGRRGSLCGRRRLRRLDEGRGRERRRPVHAQPVEDQVCDLQVVEWVADKTPIALFSWTHVGYTIGTDPSAHTARYTGISSGEVELKVNGQPQDLVTTVGLDWCGQATVGVSDLSTGLSHKVGHRQESGSPFRS